MTTGLVPTMGALHDGHRALLRAARADNDRVVMSLFVNPTQFGPDEDFLSYPRDDAADRSIAADGGRGRGGRTDGGGDVPGRLHHHRVGGAPGDRFEGAARPGHFDGVATVVLKLFERVRPDRAYFGQKDAQQLAVVRRVVRDLDLGVEIRAVPTVREPDGLALSSRNLYLDPSSGGGRPRCTARWWRGTPAWSRATSTTWRSSTPRRSTRSRPAPGALVIGAARFGGTRLIDNITLEEK